MDKRTLPAHFPQFPPLLHKTETSLSLGSMVRWQFDAYSAFCKTNWFIWKKVLRTQARKSFFRCETETACFRAGRLKYIHKLKLAAFLDSKNYRLVVDTVLWYITILPNFTFQGMWMNYLLPWRLPTAFLSPANIPSSPPILATLSFGGGPSAMDLACSCSNLHADLKLGTEHLCHTFKASILVPLSQESGFMPWSLWNAACPRECTCSAVGGSLVRLLHKGNIIPDRCCPPVNARDLQRWRNHSFLRQSSPVLPYLHF